MVPQIGMGNYIGNYIGDYIGDFIGDSGPELVRNTPKRSKNTCWTYPKLIDSFWKIKLDFQRVYKS